MIAGQFLLLAIITLATMGGGSDPTSALRHLYLLPPLWAALSLGAWGGGLIGLVAGLLQAPLALPAIERIGLSSRTIDGLVSMVIPLAFGCVVGRLVDQSRDRAKRLGAVLELQRSLGRDEPLEQRLAVVADRVRRVLGAERVGLVIRAEADAPTVVSAPSGACFEDGSAAGWTLHSGRPVSVNDLPTDPRLAGRATAGPRPIRGLILPLDSGSGAIGALAIERAGDLSAATRAAAQEMALHLALGVENARLALRQRRFAEELEGKVAAATERLRELDQAKSEFVSVVAHELRTPLTALQGFSELLLSGAVPPERARRFVGHLHREAQRLGRIVAELLDLSRIEAGRTPELRREPIDLNELMERNVELFAAEHRAHRFLWTPWAGMPELCADRDAMDRMLKNLLSNAVKYSPRGGRVSIAAGPADDRPGMIELSVEDDGVGIPARHLPRIFDKYVRLANPETVAARGLGLGLSLVRALAEAHGGSVEVESLPGKGSKFRLLLPA